MPLLKNTIGLIGLLFLCFSCKTTTPTSATDSGGGDVESAVVLDPSIPRSVNLDSALTIRRVYNSSFPAVTVTVPAGEYRINTNLTKKRSAYYQATSPVKLKIDRGNTFTEAETTGYIVVPTKSIQTGKLNTEKTVFSMVHTEESKKLICRCSARTGQVLRSMNRPPQRSAGRSWKPKWRET